MPIFPSLEYVWLWPKEYGRSDLSLCRGWGFKKTGNSQFLFLGPPALKIQPLNCEDTQVAPWRSPCGEEPTDLVQFPDDRQNILLAIWVSLWEVDSPAPVKPDPLKLHRAEMRFWHPDLPTWQICEQNKLLLQFSTTTIYGGLLTRTEFNAGSGVSMLKT